MFSLKLGLEFAKISSKQNQLAPYDGWELLCRNQAVSIGNTSMKHRSRLLSGFSHNLSDSLYRNFIKKLIFKSLPPFSIKRCNNSGNKCSQGQRWSINLPKSSSKRAASNGFSFTLKTKATKTETSLCGCSGITIESLTDTLPPVRVYRAGRPSAYNPFYCLSFIKRRLPLCINNTNSDNNSYIR